MIVIKSQGLMLNNDKTITIAMSDDDFAELSSAKIPIVGHVAFGVSGERLSQADALTNFIDEVWKLMGETGEWEYPAQVVRYLKEKLNPSKPDDGEFTAVPGADGIFHIADGNGGTLCKIQMGVEVTRWPADFCEKCAEQQRLKF